MCACACACAKAYACAQTHVVFIPLSLCMNGDRGNARTLVRTRAEHMNNRRVKPRLHEADTSSLSAFLTWGEEREWKKIGDGGRDRDNLSRLLHVTRNRMIGIVRCEQLGTSWRLRARFESRSHAICAIGCVTAESSFSSAELSWINRDDGNLQTRTYPIAGNSSHGLLKRVPVLRRLRLI